MLIKDMQFLLRKLMFGKIRHLMFKRSQKKEVSEVVLIEKKLMVSLTNFEMIDNFIFSIKIYCYVYV